MTSKTIAELEGRQAELRAQLAQTGDMRQGSLVERYRRCGKPGCHCAADDARGHGPCWSLTRAVDGKTVTHVIPAEAVPETRKQIEEHQKFRAAVRDLVDTSDRLCNARLREPDAASKEAAKKGGSRRPSRARSSPK